MVVIAVCSVWSRGPEAHPDMEHPLETPVELAIKIPTGVTPDSVLDGVTLGWTIKQVKEHISRSHPIHPVGIARGLWLLVVRVLRAALTTHLWSF